MIGQRPSRESVMTALFNVLVASVQTSFTAETAAGNVTLTNVSATKGLFLGLPVFGGTIPNGSVIAQLTPSLQLTLPPTGNATAVPMTTGFLTTGRRVKRWSDVPAQPALFLRSGDEDLEYVSTIMQKQTIAGEIWMYANAGENPDAVPETALNNLLDAVQSAFAPDDQRSGRFTLNGLVEWCRLEGRVQKDPGDTSGQAIAVLDVQITVP